MKKIKDIKIFKSTAFKDKRGHFMEIYKKNKISSKELIFDCYSYSKKMSLEDYIFKQKILRQNS